MMMRSLFDDVDMTARDDSWRSGPPPDLSNVKEIELDFETDGLKWWRGSRPTSMGICLPDGSTHFLAWAQKGGGNNISEEAAQRYVRDLRNIRLTNLNTRFELHNAREWAGADWEANNVELADVGHWAALLDDSRYEMSLSSLVRDFLDNEEKVTHVNGVQLDPTRMSEYHASIVASRAMGDVRQVHKLKKVLWPRLTEEDLHDVRKLEEEVIYAVAEMEKNGALIDTELLAQYTRDVEQEYERALWEISRETRIHNFNPNAAASWTRLFQHEGIPVPRGPEGKPTFKDVYLKGIENENIQRGRKAAKLARLKSKYITKLNNVLSPDGKIRYALHQLMAIKDENDDHSSGTISGRFASTGIASDEGWNQQQVMKVIKQQLSYGDDFIIRQLFNAPPGYKFFSADAMQIEYRIFAHFANNPRIIEQYRKDPDTSFHKFVHAMFKEHIPDLSYRRQKDLNFAKIYGAGLKKLALMMEFINELQFKMLTDTKAKWDHPLLAEAFKVTKVYDELLPEVKPLLSRASHLAMPYCSEYCNNGENVNPYTGRVRPKDELHQKFPHRGYVKTLLGRRSRFKTPHDRIHKAFNCVDQGTGADIMKRKIVELHRQRKHTGFIMCFTVHDEVDGYVPDRESALRVHEILQQQSFTQLKVPIRWEADMGSTWRDCADEDMGRDAGKYISDRERVKAS